MLKEFRELVARVDGRRVSLSALDARSAAAHEVLVKLRALGRRARAASAPVLTRLAEAPLKGGGGGGGVVVVVVVVVTRR